MSEIWFTADTHFCHDAIRCHCRRPFTSATAMDEQMIRLWNHTVSAKDLVFHLGDFAHTRDVGVALAIARALNGRKVLLIGNHDRHYEKEYKRVFEKVIQYHEMYWPGDGANGYDRIKVCLFHYPMETWNTKHWSALHLHGHSHGKTKAVANRFDVGVDSWAFAPVHLETLKAQWRIFEPFRSRSIPRSGDTATATDEVGE